MIAQSALRVVPVVALLAATAAPAADDMAGHVVVNPANLKWVDGPPGMPKGAQLVVLNGDPGKPGPFSLMAKMPANYRVPAHWHSQAENLVILSGAMYVGMGDKLDTKKADVAKPGGYVYMPAKMHHYAFTKSPTVMEVHSTGPFDITYLDSADEVKYKK